MMSDAGTAGKVNTGQRPYVISLSSIPSRFDRLSATLDLLVRQSVPPLDVQVNIPHSYRRFPDWDGVLPEVPEGVTIFRCDEDFGPATKLLPTLQRFEGQDVDILFCDDDMRYPRHWASWFLRQRARQPEACIALCGEDIEDIALEDRTAAAFPRPKLMWKITDPEHWVHRGIEAFGKRWLGWPERFLGRRQYLTGGYLDMFQGFGGVMVRPHFFDAGVFDIPPVLWSVDDFWLSGNAVKNGHPTWVIPYRRAPNSHQHYIADALTTSVIDGHDRDSANLFAERYLREHFDIWR